MESIATPLDLRQQRSRALRNAAPARCSQSMGPTGVTRAPWLSCERGIQPGLSFFSERLVSLLASVADQAMLLSCWIKAREVAALRTRPMPRTVHLKPLGSLRVCYGSSCLLLQVSMQGDVHRRARMQRTPRSTVAETRKMRKDPGVIAQLPCRSIHHSQHLGVQIATTSFQRTTRL